MNWLRFVLSGAWALVEPVRWGIRQMTIRSRWTRVTGRVVGRRQVADTSDNAWHTIVAYPAGVGTAEHVAAAGHLTKLRPGEPDAELSNPVLFRRDLHSLMQVPGAETIKALVIGRFQQVSKVERKDVELLVGSIPSLAGKPVLANVDFGHTQPMMTFPIGGTARVEATDSPRLVLTRH